MNVTYTTPSGKRCCIRIVQPRPIATAVFAVATRGKAAQRGKLTGGRWVTIETATGWYRIYIAKDKSGGGVRVLAGAGATPQNPKTLAEIAGGGIKSVRENAPAPAKARVPGSKVAADGKAKAKAKTGETAKAKTGETAKAKTGETAATHPNIDTAQKPYREHAKYIQEEHDGAVRKLAAEVGATPEKYREVMSSRLQTVVDQGDFYVRAHSGVLPRILDDGRFKSQFETGTSSGALDTRFRTKVETQVLGSKADLKPDERPIYGYLATKDHASSGSPAQEAKLAGYGDAVIRLKPGVRDRATVTLGDSLARFDQVQARPAQRVDLTMAPVESTNFQKVHKLLYEGVGKPGQQIDGLSANVSYIEAQYHGGLKVGDIQDVRFRSRPGSEVQAALKRHGISWGLVED
jgi:Protein of unknown function (DUF3626)